MKKWMFIWIAVSVLAVIGAFFGGRTFAPRSAAGKPYKQAVPARTPPTGEGMAPMAMPFNDPDFRKELDLTDDQVTKLEAIFKKYRGAGKNPSGGVRTMRQDVNNLIESDSPDLTGIDSKIDQMSAAMGEAQKNSAHMTVEMRAVMTKDQRVKLPDALQTYMQSHQGDAGHGGNGGGWGGRRGGGRGDGSGRGGQ